MTATRQSTPKHNVVTVDTCAVVYGPASKTECKQIARSLNIKDRPASVIVKPVKRA